MVMYFCAFSPPYLIVYFIIMGMERHRERTVEIKDEDGMLVASPGRECTCACTSPPKSTFTDTHNRFFVSGCNSVILSP